MTHGSSIKVYLVRHAHAMTRANITGTIIYDNQQEKGLSAKGRYQAQILTRRLKSIHIDKVFVSEAKRTYETISPILKLKKISWKKDERLNEMNYGIFSGLSYEEVKVRYPIILRTVLKDRWKTVIPKGESLQEVYARFESLIHDIEKEFQMRQGHIILVTHAINIESFLIKHAFLDVEQSKKIYIENTSVATFDLKEGRVQNIRRIYG